MELAAGEGIRLSKDALLNLVRISLTVDLAALLLAERMYPTTAAGIADTVDGEYFFLAVSGADSFPLYRNVSEVATSQNIALPAQASIEDAIEAAEAAERRYNSPFREAVSDDYMRTLIEDIWIEGGDAGADYILNYETQNLGGGNGRVTFKITDVGLGIDVCQWQLVDTQANFLARTSPTVVAYQGALAEYMGTIAVVWVNWGELVFGGGITSYTTVAQSGIRPERTLTRAEIMERFTRGAEPKITLTVGAGTETATHFNTRAAAIASLYIPGLTVTRSGPYPLSDICSFSNQVLILDVDDAIDEEATLTTISSVDQSEVVLPPFVTLRGKDRAASRFYADGGANTGPVIEAPFPFRIEDMTVENLGPGYAVHIDNVNDRAKRATDGPEILRYPMVSVMERCTIKGSAASTSWTIGCGISNGHLIRLKDCRVIGGAAQPQLGVHTSPSTTDAGEIAAIDTYFNDATIGTAIELAKSHAMTVQHRLNVKGSDLADIAVGNTAGGSAGYIRTGKIDPAITVTGTLST